MTEEEYQEYHERMQRKYINPYLLSELEYDFSEYDPPVEHRDNTATQNPDLCRGHPAMPAYQRYFLPDDIYTEERNSDPCPFVPKEFFIPYYERKISKRRRELSNADIYDIIMNAARDFPINRLDNWNLIVHLVAFTLLLGCFVLLGIHFEALYVLYPAGIISVILLICFPINRIPPLTFSKRERKYFRIYRFYNAWNNREYRRRKRLAWRNIERFHLKRPSLKDRILG